MSKMEVSRAELSYQKLHVESVEKRGTTHYGHVLSALFYKRVEETKRSSDTSGYSDYVSPKHKVSFR